MKRQSIAEITLQKQVKNLECQIDILRQSQHEIDTKIESTRNIKTQLESEIHRLRQAREASDRALKIVNKP